MILCICQAVTDREVDAAIRDGARSVGEVSRACGAGDDCRGCVRTIEQRIDQACAGDCSICPRRDAELASAAL